MASRFQEMKDYIVFENMIKDEIWLLKASGHPNVQNYVESYMHEGIVYAVAEYCRGGTLTEFIRAVLPSEPVIGYICKGNDNPRYVLAFFFF